MKIINYIKQAFNDEILSPEELEVTAKVSKEEKEHLIKASSNKKIVSFLVDQYNQSQQYRIRSQNQIRALIQGFDKYDEDQYSFIAKELDNAIAQEALNKKYMDIITDTIPVCRWMKSITGIGPVISAYLYSSFDVTIGRYNTDFLSYAGLNDNNNPWLGTEKAKEMVKEAIDYRNIKFGNIYANIEEKCANDKQYEKIIKALTKLGKNDFEYTELEEVVIGTDIDISDFDMMYNFIRWLSNEKRCDEILYDFIAGKTHRKLSNIKKGTVNNWTNKKTKTKEPTTEDLISYLAKPPYNPELKKRMFIISDMFVKNSGREKSLYGRIYKEKRAEYDRKNANGEYAEQAAEILRTKNFSKDTNAYQALIEGRLPDAQIVMRARRYAVKLFISHVFEAMYYAEYRKEPPKTYVIQYMGHHDYIPPEVDYRPYIDGEL